MEKILHIVESLDRGAVETWLIRMLRHARLRGAAADWTMYCVVGRAGALDGEAEKLGARVVHSPVPLTQKKEFICALRAELKHGKYDVLHCHHDLVSAVYLLASARLPLRRIVQAHNADEHVPTLNLLKRKLLREPMRRVCLSMADRIVGISGHVLDTMLGGRPRRPGRDTILYYGVDTSPFAAAADRGAFRRGLGLPENGKVLFFGGRLVPEKNPLFAVDVLKELRQVEPAAYAVFAGTGSQEQAVVERARSLGVESAVKMLGWRPDVPQIMGASDLFILPRPERPMEGFGLAVVEAQLSGMPMLLSEGIADDPLLSTALYTRLSLSAGPQAWAQAAVRLLMSEKPSKVRAAKALGESPMDMDNALKNLLKLYE